MTVQALRKQVDADANVYQPEEVKKMSEKTENQVHEATKLDDWHKQTIYLEKVGCAVSSLGELVRVVENDELGEFTVNGLGCLLEVLGKDILNTSLDGYNHLERAESRNG